MAEYFSPKEKTEIKKKGTDDSWYVLGVIGEIGFNLAVPIVLGALGGSFIDNKFGLYPKATLSLIFLGVLVSLYTLVKTVSKVIREI